MPTLSKLQSTYLRLRNCRGGANDNGTEVRNRKDSQNMEERGLHSQPVAIESKVEGEEKRRSYNEREHIYNGLELRSRG